MDAAFLVRNRRLGITYIEAVMAMAVFCILIIPVFPALSRTAANADLAQHGYIAHLRAQEIMLIVKDIPAGTNPQPWVAAYVNTWTEPMDYGYWLSNGYVFTSADAPGITVTLSAPGTSVLVTTVVWDKAGKPVGRAVGMVNP